MTSVQPLISVIVPCYGVEEYLPRCIDSIVGQTYRNLEIILVDDGSPDRCGEICDEYAAKDKRIKVIHKENGGLSDARNVAMDAARGEYMVFVDSDDEITPSSIEKLLGGVTAAGADFCTAGFKIVGSRSAVLRSITSVADFDRPMRSFLLRSFSHSACAKIYSTEFINSNHLRFRRGLLHEDILWTYHLSRCARRFAYVDFPAYLYFIRKGSITTEHVKPARIDSMLRLMSEMADDWRAHPVDGLGDLFAAYHDYQRFYTAVQLLKMDDRAMARRYYAKLQAAVIAGGKANKHRLLLRMDYRCFRAVFRPLLMGYKLLQAVGNRQ